MIRSLADRASIGAVCVLAVGVSVWRASVWHSSWNESATARERELATAARISELNTLKTTPATAAAHATGDTDIYTLAQMTLNAASLTPSTLRESLPEGDGVIIKDDPADGLLLRRQSVRLSFEPLTVNELGRFLDQWRKSQPVWDIARIELSSLHPAILQTGSSESGSYRVSLTVVATVAEYRAEPGGPRR